MELTKNVRDFGRRFRLLALLAILAKGCFGSSFGGTRHGTMKNKEGFDGMGKTGVVEFFPKEDHESFRADCDLAFAQTETEPQKVTDSC